MATKVQSAQGGIYVEVLTKKVRTSQGGIYVEIYQEFLHNDSIVEADVQENDDGTGYIPGGNFVTIESNASASLRKNAAFRFTNVEVPQGAKILNSTISLTATDTVDDDIDARVYAEDIDDSESFATKSNINTRQTTTAWVDWSIDNAGTNTILSPDIKRPVQEVIDRDGWVSGNAMTIILKAKSSGSKKFKAEALEGLSGAYAQLYILYSLGEALVSDFSISISI